MAVAPVISAQATGAPQASTPAPVQTAPSPGAQALPSPAESGGTIHGSIKAGEGAGAVPLPGVSVTATNTLTGKKYSTTTDITGHYSLTIPQRGRYVVRTDFAAFADNTKEALLNAASHDQTADFSLMLASRAARQEQTTESASTARQYLGGAQNLSLLNAARDLIQAGGAGGDSGVQLPSSAENSDFSSESVAVNGQNGTTNPFAGVDFGRMRDEAELNQSLNGGEGGAGGGQRGGGGGFGGGGLGGGRGGGGRGGLRGNFRNFKPNQPHGAFFWSGGNGALNAEDFAIRGQEFTQPGYATNQFGLTFMGAPYIPKLLTKDTRDILFLTLSGQRSSSPVDDYGTVPTAEERSGNFSDLKTQAGEGITIYAPSNLPAACLTSGVTPGQPFPNNTIPANCIATQASTLLGYVPNPNLPGSTQNYQRLSSQQDNTTKVGVRFIHNFGSSANGGPMMGMIRQALGQGNGALHQTLNVNYNYSHSASDNLNIFPDLGGKEQSHQYSLQLGYVIGKGRLTNNFTLGWNRTNSQTTNYFTNGTDIANEAGLSGLPSNPLLYGLPNLTLNQFTGFNEQQPNFSTGQTISFTETTSWIHGKHNVRFGGDFRRVHDDLLGNTNSTGTYVFSGLFTEAPGTSANAATGVATSGSSLADLLLGLPQETTLQAPYSKSYLRENVYDFYAQDDWRALPSLTLLYGLRYEYFSPYSENNNHLATIDVSNDFYAVDPSPVLPNGTGTYQGKYPQDLIYPERNNFSPRVGFAWRAARDTVVRGGYGINYAVGQYVKFVQDFAFQPPFADVQTNEVTNGANITLANGFPSPGTLGNYAVNRNYRLPYVQVWNLNVQRTIPWNIVLNFGYSGSKGTRLDVVDAPGRTATTSVSGVYYDYEDSVAFSNFNSLAVSARRRLSNGISLGATYTYSHSIDDASSVGGNGGSGLVVAQNWQNILAEESNSSFDIRNSLKGNFLYELPFGPDTHMITTGWLAKTLENLSLSGTFQLASGNPLTPSYAAATEDVARGSTGSLRPDRVSGQRIAGEGSLQNWFNRDAFTTPAATYGTASRFSIDSPGKVSVDMSASKTMRFADTKTFEIRATADNVFNTVQYSGVDTTVGSASYGQVTSAGSMRTFSFNARFRY
ncbi:TonB-dependent receptor [Acidipila sp. 4G-K13]|uniref:TonB-dependent receptor n=1 Tax=Paracidobacterium acidisoli TaxID=2303751 RepID=A0A372INW5_9BACT|nr:TonB-dependent receptor [Paracidobacterium acidisoli]MBT9332141.1 TonB-dependent receptor [Paracidobacterium acidisoli]